MAKIKNWKKYQHYKDRNPPWIKLHRTLLTDRLFMKLDPSASKLLVVCWLLAAEDSKNDGTLPCIEDISFRTHMSEEDVKAAFLKLNHWIEDNSSNVLASCQQDATLETETETETEVETEVEVEAPLHPSNNINSNMPKPHIENVLIDINQPRFTKYEDLDGFEQSLAVICEKLQVYGGDFEKHTANWPVLGKRINAGLDINILVKAVDNHIEQHQNAKFKPSFKKDHPNDVSIKVTAEKPTTAPQSTHTTSDPLNDMAMEMFGIPFKQLTMEQEGEINERLA